MGSDAADGADKEPFDVDAAIAAEFTVQTNQCQVCAWLDDRPRDEAEAWDRAMLKKANPHRAIFRAMAKQGFARGDGSIAGHRNNLHPAKRLGMMASS